MATQQGTAGVAVGGRGHVPLPTGRVAHRPRPPRERRAPWPPVVTEAEKKPRRNQYGGAEKGKPSRGAGNNVTPALLTIKPSNSDRYEALVALADEGASYQQIDSQISITRRTAHEWLAHRAAGGLSPRQEEESTGARDALRQRARLGPAKDITDADIEHAAAGIRADGFGYVTALVARRWLSTAPSA